VYPRFADAAWDPGPSGGVIVTDPNSSHGALAIRRSAGRWVPDHRWRTGPDYYGHPSPDGRWVAYTVTEHGRETPRVEVIDAGGDVRAFPLAASAAGTWQAVSWLDTRRVIVEQVPSGELFVWDIAEGTVRSFIDSYELPRGAAWGPMDTSMSWSAARRYFAATVWWDRGGHGHGAIVIGSASGEILRIIPASGWSTPTWSPTRPELAWVDATGGQTSGRLFRYDMSTDRRILLARSVPPAPWAAWSPRGDWLLLATYETPWTFVARDGARAITHSSLGVFPRWAGPDADVIMPVC
jgi:hypothetical protein